MPDPQPIPTRINWRSVQAVGFYAAVTFGATLLAAWGASAEIAWTPALKAASVAASGYILGKLHR